MTDDIQFEPDQSKPPPRATDRALNEERQIEEPVPPNSIKLPLWRGGYLSFQPDAGVQIFALMALVLCLITLVIVSVAGIWTHPAATWLERASSGLGNAISAIVGAMVGSAVTAAKARRK